MKPATNGLLSVLLFAIMIPAMAQGPKTQLQPPAGSPSLTLSVEFNEERQGGNLTGCFVGFDQIVNDFADRKGASVRVQGSVSIVVPKPQLLATYLQVFPTDLFRLPDGKMREAPFKPAYAYATISGLSTAGRERVPDTCPDDKGFCNGYVGDDLVVAMTQLVMTERLTVAYLRHRPGLDVVTSIDFHLPDGSGKRVLDAFLDCSGKLARQSLSAPH